jgi:hypothetical protein
LGFWVFPQNKKGKACLAFVDLPIYPNLKKLAKEPHTPKLVTMVKAPKTNEILSKYY